MREFILKLIGKCFNLLTVFFLLAGEQLFRDKFGIFLYMKPAILYTFNIWDEFLCSNSAPEIQGNLSESQHLTINFVTSVDDNQRTDYIVTRHKKVNSKYCLVKLEQRKKKRTRNQVRSGVVGR
jgi:hypothetical protein